MEYYHGLDFKSIAKYRENKICPLVDDGMVPRYPKLIESKQSTTKRFSFTIVSLSRHALKKLIEIFVVVCSQKDFGATELVSDSHKKGSYLLDTVREISHLGK